MARRIRSLKREWTAATPSGEALLERVADFYHAALPDSTDAVSFLRGLGLDHAAVSESFRIGSCDGSLVQVLPAESDGEEAKPDPVCAGLRKLGVLDKTGRETLLGCLVFPILEPEGGITGLCGIDTQSATFRLAQPCTSMIWNSPALAVHAEIIMTAGVPDALSLYAAGRANVAAMLGPELPRHDLEMMQNLGVQRVVVFCGKEAGAQMRKLFAGFACVVKSLDGGLSPNECLKRFGPRRLAELLESAGTLEYQDGSVASDCTKNTEQLPDGFAVIYSRRRYEIRGIQKTGYIRISQTHNFLLMPAIRAFMVDLQCTEADGNLCRDIRISNGEENHVGKGVECAKSAGPVFDDFNDAVYAFSDCIGESRSYKGQYAVVVLPEGVDELTHRRQSASKGRCHPVSDEALGGPRGHVFPELLELILELPCPVDAAIGLVQSLQRTRVFAGAS